MNVMGVGGRECQGGNVGREAVVLFFSPSGNVVKKVYAALALRTLAFMSRLTMMMFMRQAGGERGLGRGRGEGEGCW